MKETKSVSRRASITGMVAAPVVYQLQHTDGDAHADSTMCDAECEQMLSQQSPVQTDSGLQYKVIASGSGPMVQPGYQVVVHWVAFNQEGKEFENTLSNGQPRDVRITGTKERNVIAGLDEGISTMRVGEKRRFYIPGQLAYPKGLAAAPGRPTIPPNSPLTFDVHLLYIPGLEEELEQ